jgi:hypothetical protein
MLSALQWRDMRASGGNHVKHTKVFVWSAQYFSEILTKFGVPGSIFIKVSSIKFHEICPVGTFCGRRDEWTDLTNLIGDYRDLAPSA